MPRLAFEVVVSVHEGAVEKAFNLGAFSRGGAVAYGPSLLRVNFYFSQQ